MTRQRCFGIPSTSFGGGGRFSPNGSRHRLPSCLARPRDDRCREITRRAKPVNPRSATVGRLLSCLAWTPSVKTAAFVPSALWFSRPESRAAATCVLGSVSTSPTKTGQLEEWKEERLRRPGPPGTLLGCPLLERDVALQPSKP